MRSQLLSIAYLLVVVPAGLLRRAVDDPLDRRPDRKAASYWIAVDGAPVGGKAVR